MDNEKVHKQCKLFECKLCDYNTSRNSQYSRHLLTPKHLSRTNDNIKGKIDDNGNAIVLYDDQLVEKYVCDCGKGYRHCSGLSRHKRICKQKCSQNKILNDACDIVEPVGLLNTHTIQIDLTENTPVHEQQNSPVNEQQNSKDVMCELLKELCITNKQNVDLQKQNAEFQNRLLEFMKDNTNHFVSNNITNNTCNNTQVNVNMFLNEQCKDAITLNAFIQSISPTFDEVLYMANNGNKEGLYKIIKNSFSQIELTKRPMHCTDLKRHTTYVKDETGWLKEHDQTHLRKLCGKVEHACLVKTLAIIEGDERYTTNGTEEYEDSIRMMQESVGGRKGPVHNHGLILKSLEEQIALDQEKMKNTIKN